MAPPPLLRSVQASLCCMQGNLALKARLHSMFARALSQECHDVISLQCPLFTQTPSCAMPLLEATKTLPCIAAVSGSSERGCSG
jgi:hypothetical protein